MLPVSEESGSSETERLPAQYPRTEQDTDSDVEKQDYQSACEAPNWGEFSCMQSGHENALNEIAYERATQGEPNQAENVKKRNWPVFYAEIANETANENRKTNQT